MELKAFTLNTFCSVIVRHRGIASLSTYVFIKSPFTDRLSINF